MTELSKNIISENPGEDTDAISTPASAPSDGISEAEETAAAGPEDKDEDIPVVCPEGMSDYEFDEYYAAISMPDYEDIPDDDERYISNSSRMRTFLQEKQSAEPVPSLTAPARKTLRGAISNFVYHHRFLSILIAAAIIAAAIWGGVAYSRGRVDYSIGIYTEDMSFSREELSAIERSLAAYGKDINNDGRVVVRVRAYNPIGDDAWTFFTQTAYLKRDLYGDGKHGSRINDILITDKAVSDILRGSYGTNFFDKLSGDEYWVNISGTVLPDEIPDGLGIMLLSRNMYIDREISVPRYNNARGLIETIAERNDGLFDF